MRRMIRNVTVSALLVAACASTVRIASAQNALGTGNALDSNLNANGDRINARQATENFADRNLIVTGDVAGGRGFRGSVGYTGAQDFRGNLGSNDLFRFRAESALSSPDFVRMGSTTDQFKVGQTIGAIPYYRSGSGQINPQEKSGVDFGQLRRTERSIDRTALSRSSGYTLQVAAEPNVVGLTYNKEGTPFLFNASSARGLYAQQLDQSVTGVGLTSFDAARVREDQEKEGEKAKKKSIGAEFQTQFSDLRFDDKAEDGTAAESRIDSNSQPDYARVLKQIANRYAGRQDVKTDISPELMKSLDSDYKRLRDQLTAQQADKNAKSAVPNPSDSDATSDGKKPDDHTKTSPLGGPRTADDKKKPMATADYAAILRHGEKIEHLSTESKDRLNELITSAEQKLREGDYFWAERRFERALRFAPDHPLALAGIAHSQLGAGLYLSAALSLRSLLTHQPEMIDATYDPALLPKPEAMADAAKKIREQLTGQSDRASFGLLLAYIGRHTNDRPMIEEGLKAMGDAEPGGMLMPLLHDVWLGGKTVEEAKPSAAPKATDEPGK